MKFLVLIFLSLGVAQCKESTEKRQSNPNTTQTNNALPPPPPQGQPQAKAAYIGNWSSECIVRDGGTYSSFQNFVVVDDNRIMHFNVYYSDQNCSSHVCAGGSFYNYKVTTDKGDGSVEAGITFNTSKEDGQCSGFGNDPKFFGDQPTMIIKVQGDELKLDSLSQKRTSSLPSFIQGML